jgi:hypothetical protein
MSRGVDAMRPLSRRVFVGRAVGGVAVVALGARVPAAAAAGAMLDEADPQAVSLGYKADTTRVDGGKFAQHAAAQTCGGCALFQGAAAGAAGGCAVFPGKTVARAGWCSAWTPR